MVLSRPRKALVLGLAAVLGLSGLQLAAAEDYPSSSGDSAYDYGEYIDPGFNDPLTYNGLQANGDSVPIDENSPYPPSDAEEEKPNVPGGNVTPLPVQEDDENDYDDQGYEPIEYDENNLLKCPADTADWGANDCNCTKTYTGPKPECDCNCKPTRIPPPVEPVPPLQVCFLIDTSDSMQDPKKVERINFWIYSMVKKLQRKLYPNASERKNFIVLVQFADRAIVDWADNINNNALDRKFEQTLTQMSQQQTGTNGYQALHNLVTLLRQKSAADIEKQIEAMKMKPDSGHDGNINSEAWAKTIENNKNKLLFMITDGNLRDRHGAYDQFYPDEGGLIPAVGKTFNRTDILILETPLRKVDPGLKELSKYGYLEQWQRTNDIIKSIDEVSSRALRDIDSSAQKIEVRAMVEKFFCPCWQRSEGNFRYLHDKQFIKKVVMNFYRKANTADVDFKMVEYYAKALKANKKCETDDYQQNHFGECCQDTLIGADMSSVNRPIDVGPHLNTFTYFPARQYTCKYVNMEYMLSKVSSLFRGRLYFAVRNQNSFHSIAKDSL